jgi:hypothetical protein
MSQEKTCPVCHKTFHAVQMHFCEIEKGFSSELDKSYNSQNINEKSKLEISVRSDRLYFGSNFSVEFERTLRLPDDGKVYPLPPGLGSFPVCRVSDYADKVPAEWNDHGGVFIPMYQREALWISLNGRDWRPNAVKIGVGKINAITGDTWNQKLSGKEQDYIVCPPQLWLDGIKTGRDVVRQFVAMPLGEGYTIEGQLTGEEKFGGIQIIVYEPKPGKFPDREPEYNFEDDGIMFSMLSVYDEMGISAGGKMEQKIYEDEYGVETWDENNLGRVYVHIVNSLVFREITGKEPPPSPISAKTYAEYGLPWFDLYDEDKNDVPVSEKLYTIKPVKLIDKMKGLSPQQDDDSVEISADNIKTIEFDSKKVTDGDW